MADSDKLTREQRLAARLRENLHRRKAQSRAAADAPHPPPPPLSKERPDG
jgi:hypothetical protein